MMMRRIRHIAEKAVEGLFTFSGAVTTLTILLIVVFLFREGLGLFKAPGIDKGYSLCVHPANPVQRLSSHQIKELFDYNIENWQEVGGPKLEVVPFRFEEIFTQYAQEAFGEDYALLPQILEDKVAKTPGILAVLPTQYLPPSGCKTVEVSRISLAQVFGGKDWIPTASPAPQLGALPLILGTLWVSLAAILMALPLGLGVAVYLSELAGPLTRKLLKPAIELLAGIPSVVYGFFGLVVLVPLVQRSLDLPVGETGFTGSLILALMALPTIITVAEDALRATPRAMRESSLALGATHWQTITRVVIPYAGSGISAAVVLGIGRAMGETMAVLMVTGNAAVVPTSLFAPLRTLPATIAAELGEAPAGGTHYQSLFILGCLLFLMSLGISVAAEYISRNQKQRGV